MIWHTILKTAILAPSPHNVQPWKVKILSDSEAELHIDSTRTLPKEDVTGSFIILTMGMFLEAVKILAAQQGFALSYELFHEPDWYAPAIIENSSPCLFPFATMRLAPGESSEHQYPPELFSTRRTSRISLLPKPVPQALLQDFTDMAARHDQEFAYTVDQNEIESMLALNTRALFEDLNSPDYHDEIVEWFRYSERQSQIHLDGLDYRAMNTPRTSLWLSARAPWLMKTPVVKNILAFVYRQQTGLIPTMGILAGGFWEPADAIESGKFLMRFWLETARHDLYIHPFGNLVTNRPVAKEIAAMTGIENIWLVFKIGYSPAPPQSLRLPLERILIS